MLTALSTVLGLLPIAPTLFWGPMAFAIMGGLLVATLLTLVFLPVLYVTLTATARGPAPNRSEPMPDRAAPDSGADAPLAWSRGSDKASYYRLYFAYVIALFATRS
jgi:multidrug efflux pump